MISSSPTRRGINIFAAEGAPVVAVNDGVIEKLGNSKKLGHYVVLEDAYGNRFTYAELGTIRPPAPRGGDCRAARKSGCRSTARTSARGSTRCRAAADGERAQARSAQEVDERRRPAPTEPSRSGRRL